MQTQIKHAGAIYWVGYDFAPSLNPGETLTESNARGALSVTARDEAGVAVPEAVASGPAIEGTQVRWMVGAGTPGQRAYYTVTAPTSDGELLVGRVMFVLQ